MGLEPTTSSLENWCSTIELLPQIVPFLSIGTITIMAARVGYAPTTTLFNRQPAFANLPSLQ